ncbi:MAG: NUDIX hydrolase [bacterium]|nr:NUDIX hydrolase [bacterium]
MTEGLPVMKNPQGSRACPCSGVIVRHRGKILMLDRLKGVLGWACPAGHRDSEEFPLDCAKRELFEETDIDLAKARNLGLVLHSEISNNACGRGANSHVWHVYSLEVNDDYFKLKEPTKHSDMNWFSPEEIAKMNLEPVWRLILEEVGILKKVA